MRLRGTSGSFGLERSDDGVVEDRYIRVGCEQEKAEGEFQRVGKHQARNRFCKVCMGALSQTAKRGKGAKGDAPRATRQGRRANGATAAATGGVGRRCSSDGRAGAGRDCSTTEEVDQALHAGVADWNRHPTPFLWSR